MILETWCPPSVLCGFGRCPGFLLGLPFEKGFLRLTVGLSERLTGCDEFVDLICDEEILSHGAFQLRLFHHKGGNCLLKQSERAHAKVTGFNKGLLRALKVAVVAAAQANDGFLDLHLEGAKHLAVRTHDLEEVVILFLRHDRGTCDEVVRKSQELRLLLREHHHVCCKARTQHHGKAHRLQGYVLEHTAAEPAIHGVRLRPCEAHQLRRLITV
mmetsp:Transcript_38768/g.91023  ORF Transcript_38768/g.91023 Transcript_38768/m.91023 type:complete len:214 (+) Transcript_38768:109-750(+)